MAKAALWLLGSGATGGIVGASAALWLAPRTLDASSAPERPRAEASENEASEDERASNPELMARIDRLERSVRLLEMTRRLPPSVKLDTPAGGGEAGSSNAAPPSPASFDPVFEAAVLDIIDRAEEDRDSERDVRRRERNQQRAEHWADELTARLGLSPQQRTKALEIQQRLSDDLLEQRAANEGKFVPREQRRAATRALRARAESELREVLDTSQLTSYDALEDRWKIQKPGKED